MRIVRAGAPAQAARISAVLVHGRAQDEHVMLDVVRRLALDDVSYVLPVAEQRSWYPARYFDPLAVHQPHLERALDAIEEAIDATDAEPARIVLGGFSQGGCIIAELIARRPRPFAGAAILTGARLGQPGEAPAPRALDGLPMFFSFSRRDAWITPQDAAAAVRDFEAAGAQVTVAPDDDPEHRINDTAVAGLRRLLAPGTPR